MANSSTRTVSRYETSAVYGIPMGISLAIIGVLTNLILIYFLFNKRVKKSLGDKFLLCLNILDMFICLCTIANLLMIDFEEIFIYEKVYRETKKYYIILVECSGITTCFLCGLRTISIKYPFYAVRNKVVYFFFGLFTTCLVIRNLIVESENADSVIISLEEHEELEITPQVFIVEIEMGAMILFVVASSVVCVVELSSSTVPTEKRQKGSSRQATIMVLILCALFVFFNTIRCMFIILALFVVKGDDVAFPKMSIYIPMVVNSAANPLVYFTRNSEMKKYLGDLVKKYNIFSPRWRVNAFQTRGNTVETRGNAVGTRAHAVATILNVVETRGNTVETRKNAVETRKNAVEKRGNTVEKRGNAVEKRGNSVETRGNAVETRGNSVEKRENAVETRGNAVETRGNAVETRGNSVEKRENAVEKRGNAVETRGNAVETRGNAVETILNAVEKRGNSVETRGNAVRTILNVVETRVNAVETRENTVETRENTIEKRGNAVETRGNTLYSLNKSKCS